MLSKLTLATTLLLAPGTSAFSSHANRNFKCAPYPSMDDIDVSLPEAWFDSNKFGAGDTDGAINHIAPDMVVKHMQRLVKTGKCYSLAQEADPEYPAFGDRYFGVNVEHHVLGARAGYHEDEVVASIGVATHIDGLSHVSMDGHLYGGATVDGLDAQQQWGVSELSAADIPPIATRAVILDMLGFFGGELTENQEFSPQDLADAAEAQGVCLDSGDVLLLHTGREPTTGAVPGIGPEAAKWIADLGIVAVGADTWAVEAYPSDPKYPLLFHVHAILLPLNGVYIIENVRTEELVAEGISEAFFVLGTPRLAGSVQARVAPVVLV